MSFSLSFTNSRQFLPWMISFLLSKRHVLSSSLFLIRIPTRHPYVLISFCLYVLPVLVFNLGALLTFRSSRELLRILFQPLFPFSPHTGDGVVTAALLATFFTPHARSASAMTPTLLHFPHDLSFQKWEYNTMYNFVVNIIV